MTENRVEGYCQICEKVWLCEPSEFKGDFKEHYKLHKRWPGKCDCIKQGRIIKGGRAKKRKNY